MNAIKVAGMKSFQGAFLRLILVSLAVFSVSLSWAGGKVAVNGQHFSKQPPVLLTATRVFDGFALHTDYSILVADGKVAEIGPTKQIRKHGVRELNLGDATILPGFIEMHGHMAFQNIPRDTVLRHGITTVRDVGGPLLPPSGGNGSLRFLTSGPIITTPGGYPIPVFGQPGHGHGEIAAAVETPEQAREVVRRLVKGGAAIIKIGLDPGGEAGAPWTTGHTPSVAPPWPMLSLETVKAIVDEAHKQGKQVAAHLSEPHGVELSLVAGIDEWSHIPCMEIPDNLLQQAVQQNIRIVTTIDALSHCPNIHQNTVKLAKLGARFFYGAEIAHTDIPWGIDAEELHLMMRLTGMTALTVFQTATSKAGAELGLAPLGTLTPGAPADIIAVKGNAFEKFKLLEYPDFVMSGGQEIVNRFGGVCTGPIG